MAGVYVANLPICGPLLTFSPAAKHWGPLDGRGYVANLAPCGPLLILSPAPKHWGPRRKGLRGLVRDRGGVRPYPFVGEAVRCLASRQLGLEGVVCVRGATHVAVEFGPYVPRAVLPCGQVCVVAWAGSTMTVHD